MTPSMRDQARFSADQKLPKAPRPQWVEDVIGAIALAFLFVALGMIPV